VWRFSALFLSATAMIVTLPFAIMKSGYFLTGIALGVAASPVWVWILITGLNRYGKIVFWYALAA